jgi:hypothetical protein
VLSFDPGHQRLRNVGLVVADTVMVNVGDVLALEVAALSDQQWMAEKRGMDK